LSPTFAIFFSKKLEKIVKNKIVFFHNVWDSLSKSSKKSFAQYFYITIIYKKMTLIWPAWHHVFFKEKKKENKHHLKF
jgi:hypothetical protein